MNSHFKYSTAVSLILYLLVAGTITACGGGGDDNVMTTPMTLDPSSVRQSSATSAVAASETADTLDTAALVAASPAKESARESDAASARDQSSFGVPEDPPPSHSDLVALPPTTASPLSMGKPKTDTSLIVSVPVFSTTAGRSPVVSLDSQQVWKKIAVENEPFTLKQRETVRYGSGTAWIQKSVSGNAACSTEYFGNDPIHGIVKECAVQSASRISIPLPHTRPVPRSLAVNTFDQETIIGACSTTPVETTSDLTKLSVAVGRASGVAPLSVFFDATGTISSTTSRPFHEIEYRWNFGESSGPGIAPWNQGSTPGVSSRNTATGPVAGHVFETPGVYTVTVADATRTVSYQCNITVQSPEAVFEGAKTACFSTSGNFAGCPAGASLITTSDFAAVKNVVTPTNGVRRLLLRRGETWTVGQPAVFTADGPALIGAFGSGPLPVISPTTAFPSSETLLAFSSATTPTMKDWRLMDVKLDASSRSGDKLVGVTGLGGIDQLTLLRVNADSFRLSLEFSESLLDVWNRDTNPIRHGHHIWRQLSVVDMDIVNMPTGIAGDTSTWSYGTYLGAEQLFFAGTAIDGYGTSAQGVSHNTRFTYLGKASISNNTLQRPGPTEHNIKLQAPLWGEVGVAGTAGIGQGYTRWVVISDNKFVGAAGAWLIAVGPPDDVSDVRGKDIILERNWQVSGSGSRVSQLLWWSDITSRNNIFDMSAGSAKNGIFVGKRGSGQMAPDRVSIYNNTFYSSSSGNNFIAVDVDSNARNVVVKNNLAYAPYDSYRTMINGTGSASAPVIASSNSIDLRVDPLFIGNTSTALKFKLQSGSYAIGAGTSVPVFSDFLSAVKSPAVTPGIGAIEN